MSAIASRATATALPNLLAWRALGFRTVCSGRLGFAPSNPEPPVSAGTKVLDTFKEEFEIGSRVITLETGKIARFANGSVVLGMDETKVLSTITCAKTDSPRDFLPLTVDYQEKQFAQGVIPSSYMRREGAPKERELLCGRLIDRPIRPLFPSGFYHEVQVMASVLSSDGKQDPDVLATNATSAALMLSDIPWGGPIGVIRIGRICGQFVVNPTMDELSSSDLNLVYACTRDKTMMIDVQAREISEKDLAAALRLAHPEASKYLEPQIRLAEKAGKQKKEYKLSMISEKTLERVGDLAATRIESIFTDPSYGKFERGEALDNIAQDVKKVFEEEGDEESLKVLPKAVDTVRKKVVRARMISDGFRVDGRHLDEVRPIYCEAGHLPALHGSALFSRGDTQVLCTVTLGAPGDAQSLDSVVGPPKKRFMLHYSFPPFCTNEVGKRGGLNRREVGHGTLAEKALLAVLPPEELFPYTVRINSEVMASDGSTSMASVCGGSMALMDAGIPLLHHVAGVSVGLITDVDPSNGEVKDYRIVTDILGLEDHLGDMDFKIAGTRNGVTAIQLDIKPAGIPLDIICESLEHARKGRLQILDHMEREINVPRPQDDVYSPRLATLRYTNDALRSLIGPMGSLKRKVEEETGARLSVGDGTLTIVAKNQTVMEKVQEKIDFIIGREIEVGGIYKGTVTTIKEYGAFVEFNGGQQGLLHISELSHDSVSKVSDVVSIGQQLSMMCIGTDVRGNIKLSLKAVLPRPASDTKNLVKESSPLPREMSDAGETAPSATNGKEGQKSSPKNSTKGKSPATPAVVIRSAAECDEAEKSACLDTNTENSTKPSKTVKQNRKVKSASPKDDTLLSILSDSKLLTSAKAKITSQKDKQSESEAEDRSTSMNAQKLKIGTEVTAKVSQVRTRGLVLDLGGGIRGMYKFEDEEETDFELGDTMRVKCTSFTGKGIPVMSLVEED
ncbi:PREDICTED: polyribonucleotide nucleotidyltransferase 2, mitochondrial [Tarenaya hassleriana]|uniref:polyribonucleotide nucleotidyltransferase 2, mitochondrial n=1 Tax=Tarenaya hassleriana TaxID=28532 RepID=UPI00053C9A28|nr:PREDICTED: polyribonucleotide nucleotidyltransferase 2, mitochondrial [Tarenaya hassleriana]XP_010550152.1 PREDICTED: polyribonucleotide nucleotidyltransferase 2, mitochondrial [Tarenaya hassleriana]